LLEFLALERFREAIGSYVVCAYVAQFNSIGLNMLSNKVILHIDVLGPGMMFWILGQSNGPLVVCMDRDCVKVATCTANFLKETAQLECLFRCQRHGHILGFAG
jgi:hypothetical protein